MKKAIRLILICVLLLAISVVMHLLIDGVPLLGFPNVENIERVIVEHGDYPDEIKEYTDEKNIELAVGLLGYLRYSPLKGLSDDNRLIQITYIMDDGTKCVVAANDYTVWWNGKPSALRDENTFVKMCTAVFFSENN